MLNLTKCAVLRVLCRRAERVLHARGVATADAFIGLLGTGAMTLEYVSAALNHLRTIGTSGTVEILFHPGRARIDEASLWNGRPALQDFYLSEDRDREAELLRSTDLGQLLSAYRAADVGSARLARRAECARGRFWGCLSPPTCASGRLSVARWAARRVCGGGAVCAGKA